MTGKTMAGKMHRMKRPKIHPACLVFPRLSDEELQELADDIGERGLLHPIVLLDGKVLDGRNRLEACKIAGVEPRFIEWDGDGSPLEWVISTNLIRRHLTSSQRAVIAHDILPLLEEEAKQRQRLSNGRGKKVAKDLATFSGNGKATKAAAQIARTNSAYVETVKSLAEKAPQLVEKIRAGVLSVPDAKRLADSDPADLDDILSEDDRAILKAAKEIRQRRKNERNERQVADERQQRTSSRKRRLWKITADQRVVKCHALITDPPYGITNEPWEPDDLESFTREWCHRWSSCEADFIAIFWSQEGMFDARNWFDESLEGYQFQQILVWHASNDASPKNRQWFKQTWVPIFLYRRRGSKRAIISKSKSWDTELHNYDCHIASLPQTVYTGHDLKQHPCQKPVSVMRWLVNALTEPGELVVDPYCGVGSTGIAAVQLGRRFHGIEIDEAYRESAEARITTYGHEKPEPGRQSQRQAGRKQESEAKR
jgi:DNA modification methylase